MNEIKVQINVDPKSSTPYYLTFTYEGDQDLYKRIIQVSKEKKLIMFYERQFTINILGCWTIKESTSALLYRGIIGYSLVELLSLGSHISFRTRKQAEKALIRTHRVLNRFLDEQTERYYSLLIEQQTTG